LHLARDGWDVATTFWRATPGGRVSRPDDCANLVRFLCSADGGWINGQLLHSDGGLT
jgi:3-oxoacyl-[acyl-carrier protein] reductase